ncbi:uncharacterized protein [Nicotiana sylvestris]|uniref:uncharacterized protein n=1 Tax=Nicotiana sylvestris TaxID=4096 RepID=UPI00388C34E4
MIEIVHKDGEPKKSSKSVMMIRASESNLVKAPDSTKAMPLTVEGVTEKSSSLNSKPPVLVVKGLSKDIRASPESSKVVVLGIPSKSVIVVKGAPITPIIIKPVTQRPVVDVKAVLWNYKHVIVKYKGKEIEEEVNETGGLTRSGRCFTPEELRKARPFNDSQMPIKKSVTEEEAEEFLKKMKVQDYSMGLDDDFERGTPDKITVNHLEKIAGKIFEANRITFSDNELPVEGTEHNRSLYLTVKCEDSVVSRVLVDNGSSANICPLSTLQKLKIGTERIHLNSVCVRGFDGGGKDSVGDIMLELSIWPVEFYHGIPSDKQEIVVHGDKDLSACNDTIIPFIEAEDDKGLWVYQTFEIVTVKKIPEGKCILGHKLSSASVMVANEMLKNSFVPGKGLGSSLQGIVHPVRPNGNPGLFGLGFTPIEKDVKRVKNLKQKVWSLSKPVTHISKSFVKPGAEKPPTSLIPKPMVDVDEELIKRFQSLFDEVNVVEVGEGSSKADVQLVGPNMKLSNWEATSLSTRKEVCSFYAGCNDMTCMKNFQPSLKSQYNSEITTQEVKYDDEIDYDEEAAFKEISKELKQFEEKPKPNLSETETINLGDQDDVRENKISVHLEPQVKEEIIKSLFEYKDVFAWL